MPVATPVTAVGAGTNSSAPMSVLPLTVRGSPSKSAVPFAAALTPLSMGSEPAFSRKLPAAALTKTGAADWRVRAPLVKALRGGWALRGAAEVGDVTWSGLGAVRVELA